MAGDVGQPDHGAAECEHGREVGVVGADNPEHVRRDGQRLGDTGERAAVSDGATAALDHGDVGPVIPQQVHASCCWVSPLACR